MTTRSLRRLPVAILLLVLLAGPARAVEVQRSDNPHCDLEMRGVIGPEAVDAFAEISPTLSSGGVSTFSVLCLDSPGGSFQAGLDLFEAFRDAGVITAVPPGWRCHSACALAFLGGNVNSENTGLVPARAVYPGGELGFHAPSLNLEGRDGGVDVSLVNSAFATAVAATDAIVRVSMMEERGVRPMSGYVLRRILGTLPEDMFVLRTVADFALSEVDPFPLPDPGPLSAGHVENICDLTVFRHRDLEEQADLAGDGLGAAFDAFRNARRSGGLAVEVERHTAEPVADGLPGVTRVRGLVSGYEADDPLYELTCAVIVEPFEARHASAQDGQVYGMFTRNTSRHAEVVLYRHHMDFPIAGGDVPVGLPYEFNLPPGAEEATVLNIPVWFAFGAEADITALSPAPTPAVEDAGLHADRPRGPAEACIEARTPGAPAAQLCASSVLPPQGSNDYEPANLFDGDPATAWVEGVQGTGPGEAVSWDFAAPADLSYLGLINGYAKSDRTFVRNARIRRVRLTSSTGVSQDIEFRDDPIWQDYRLEGMEGVLWIRMEILETYPGTHYADTALSEVRVN